MEWCRGSLEALALGAPLFVGGYAWFVYSGRELRDLWSSVLFLGGPFVFIVYGAAGVELKGRFPLMLVVERIGDGSDIQLTSVTFWCCPLSVECFFGCHFTDGYLSAFSRFPAF